MHETHNKTCTYTSRAPHTFPLCLTCWRKSKLLGCADRAHFPSSLWSWVCDWGLGFAVFWREVTVLLNAKHLKYLRPSSLFHFKGMARSSGLPQITFAYCSSNWVKRCTSWSCYLIYWTASIHFCSGKIRRLASRLSDKCKSTTASWGKLLMSSRLGACWSRHMCRKSIPCFSEVVFMTYVCLSLRGHS